MTAPQDLSELDDYRQKLGRIFDDYAITVIREYQLRSGLFPVKWDKGKYVLRAEKVNKAYCQEQVIAERGRFMTAMHNKGVLNDEGERLFQRDFAKLKGGL